MALLPPAEGRRTLSDVLCIEGLPQVLSDLADPATTATLAACSSAMAVAFGEHFLWVALLVRHFGVSREEAERLGDPRRAFARVAVCRRWALDLPLPLAPVSMHAAELPPPPEAQLISPALVQRTLTASLEDEMLLPSGDHEALENAPPRRALRELPQRVAAPPCATTSPATTGALWSATDPSAGDPARLLSSCTLSRLRKGLQDIMLSPMSGVSACPERPYDWSLWSALIECPEDGSAFGGMQIKLRVRFPCEGAAAGNKTETPAAAIAEAEAEAAAGLPTIEVLQPTRCFHPNIDPVTGRVCPLALSGRCCAVALVRAQLLALIGLFQRPAFGVAPLNREAAMLWYGDRPELCALVCPAGAPLRRPSPLNAPDAADVLKAHGSAGGLRVRPLLVATGGRWAGRVHPPQNPPKVSPVRHALIRTLAAH